MITKFPQSQTNNMNIMNFHCLQTLSMSLMEIQQTLCTKELTYKIFRLPMLLIYKMLQVHAIFMRTIGL